MTGIRRAIFRLRLRAQHHLIQKLFVLGACAAREDLVELRRPVEAGLRGANVKACKEFAQRHELLSGRRVVNPVNQRRLLRFESLGSGHIRLNHEFFDELMRIEPVGHHHMRDKAATIEHDLAFRQVKVERRTLVARFL